MPKALKPPTDTDPAVQYDGDSRQATVTLTAQPDGNVRTNRLVVVDDSASFWNAYDFSGFAGSSLAAPIDRVQVDALVGIDYVIDSGTGAISAECAGDGDEHDGSDQHTDGRADPVLLDRQERQQHTDDVVVLLHPERPQGYQGTRCGHGGVHELLTHGMDHVVHVGARGECVAADHVPQVSVGATVGEGGVGVGPVDQVERPQRSEGDPDHDVQHREQSRRSPFVEALQVHRVGLAVLLEQQRGDEEPAEEEEHVHQGSGARDHLVDDVTEHDDHHADPAQPVEGGPRPQLGRHALEMGPTR